MIYFYHLKKRKKIKKLKVAIIFPGRITAYEHCTGLDDLYNRYDCTAFCSLNKSNTNEYLNTFFRKYNIGSSQTHFEKTVYPEWLFKLKKHPRETLGDTIRRGVIKLQEDYKEVFKI